ncbi:HSP90 family protein [Paenibacillus methanolicus]|uniref:Molecular chaperone HtpG n=1 Tax=Paenibacillus methanolicus TaxID=582686 RepID=A0A5S5BTR0_9BACL|nr:HSP90 family protein [Paenibacillus methanolicus]TYP69530.1 molecular chaperone HtpG [Paenibacillus methanolicus]
MNEPNAFRFQVNLGGMIDILSNHLYSSPKVFLRELLQNATDAITARRKSEPGLAGEISVELVGEGSGSSLVLEDNGVGLTEEEIHQFLAMIGQSSKGNRDFLSQEITFIGRFGIGLLSCFMVSDEIVMITRSAQEGSPPLEWRGKADGTYTIRKLEIEVAPGTKVYLRCKPGCEDYFTPGRVGELLYHYGVMLPYPIRFQYEGGLQTVNEHIPDWLAQPDVIRTRKQEALQFGRRLLGETFTECIPLQTSSGRTGGIAYILPYTVNLNAKKTHRVYLKQMLVSEKAENILPDWAFFVKCLIWTDELQPTASREGFYENERLDQVREELGDSIRRELIRMSAYEPDRLQSVIRLHAHSMKALAAEDDTFFRVIYKWLPFESTYGQHTLGELMERSRKLGFTRTVDEYRQIAHIAKAQSLLIINGGYVYDAELIDRLPEVCPDVEVEQMASTDVSLAFGDLSEPERHQYYEALRQADAILQRFRCRAELKRFQPESLPALYLASKEYNAMRSIELTKQESTPLFASILTNVSNRYHEAAYATLVLNLNNPMIARLFAADAGAMLPTALEMLYVNALLMGHYPLRKEELSLFNEGLLRLMDLGLNGNN